MSVSFQAWHGDLQTAANSTSLLSIGVAPIEKKRRQVYMVVGNAFSHCNASWEAVSTVKELIWNKESLMV
jgi:hypothetical protein